MRANSLAQIVGLVIIVSDAVVSFLLGQQGVAFDPVVSLVLGAVQRRTNYDGPVSQCQNAGTSRTAGVVHACQIVSPYRAPRLRVGWNATSATASKRTGTWHA